MAAVSASTCSNVFVLLCVEWKTEARLLNFLCLVPVRHDVTSCCSLTPLHLLISHDVNTPSSTSAFTAAVQTPPGLTRPWSIHLVFSHVRVITYSSKHLNVLFFKCTLLCFSTYQNWHFTVYKKQNLVPFNPQTFDKRRSRGSKNPWSFCQNGEGTEERGTTGGQSSAAPVTENTVLCQMKI